MALEAFAFVRNGGLFVDFLILMSSSTCTQGRVDFASGRRRHDTTRHLFGSRGVPIMRLQLSELCRPANSLALDCRQGKNLSRLKGLAAVIISSLQ